MRCLSLVVRAAISIAVGHAAAGADPAVMTQTRADQAVSRYGVTGRGVVVAILDRGIDWTHPDFIKPDGNTRIKWLLDMTGQSLCSGGPAPVEYSEQQINAALHGGPAIASRDAVGHGTVTAGIAAGNGRAFGGGRYAGLAPEADLIVVKMTSEGAPAHGGQPAEAAFQGCIDQALDWLDGKLTALGEPCVAIINSGTQWGPMDGTSAVSRKIDAVFGLDRPGRVYVQASGDEGALPNHARVSYSSGSPGVVHFNKTSAGPVYLCMWYTGAAPATVTVSFDGGAGSGPAPVNACTSAIGFQVCQYAPGNAFYPWRSSGPDRAVWALISSGTGQGTISFAGQQGAGVADIYGPIDTSAFALTSSLAPGRLNDYATTTSAIVVGCHVLRDAWTDVDGVPRSFVAEGSQGQLWLHSSGGPTRDGRAPGVDLTAPGQNVFAAYGRDTFWATYRFNLAEDGGGWYGRQGATSGSAPIVVGAVALMLQMDPQLTARQARGLLRAAAVSDTQTGQVPNDNWGYGKLDVLGAMQAEQAQLPLDRADAMRALKVASGLVAEAASDRARLDLVSDGASAGRIDLADAVAVLHRSLGG